MAKPVCETKIHKPNNPPIVIEHISKLEEHGATAVLIALGYMKTGVDGIWYARDYLTIIENKPRSQALIPHRPRDDRPRDDVIDVPIKP